MHEASTEHLEFGPAQYYAKSISQCAASPTKDCGISFCAVSSSVFATALFSEQSLSVLCPKQDSSFNPETCLTSLKQVTLDFKKHGEKNNAFQSKAILP